jgi:phage N-6-adenine-methyltransferase
MSRSSYGQDPTPSAVKRRWRTPRPLFDAVNARYSFGLDAAAEDGRLVPSFITPEMDTLAAPWALYCPSNGWGETWAFLNPPWGNRCADFAGTQAFTRRALSQRSTLTGVVLLCPSAPDTCWWRECFSAASDVRFLPRIRFEHPDTGAIGDSPPGCGMTLFELRAHSTTERRVSLADGLGRVA